MAAIITALYMTNAANKLFLVEIPAHGGEIREGVIGLPRTINPVIAVTDVDKDIGSLVYSGLMKYDGDNLVGDIAKSYSISDDGLTYDFIIKDKVLFQDGTRLTAEDIAFTIQKIQDPAIKSPRRADWAQITTRVVSPSEIQFLLKQPYSPFISNTTVGIIPKHIWGNVNNEQFIFSEFNIKPLGSGPYKVTNTSRDSGGIPTTMSLTTWDQYYGKIPFVEKISFNFFADQEKALTALDAGNIDSLPSISPDPASRLSKDVAQAYTILSSPMPRIFGVFLNQNHSTILADKNFRQVLNMSVDRAAIVDEVLNGYGEPINGPLPYDGKSQDAAIVDQMGAVTLLEKSGWKKGADGIYAKKADKKSATTTLSFDLYTAADSQDLKQAADMLAKEWLEVGIKVNVKSLESGDLYQNVIRTRTYDALLLGGQIGKERDLYAFWHSSQRNSPGLNVSMYTNSKADTILENIRKTSDDAARNKLYKQFVDIINADIPAVFLYSPSFIYATPKTLHNVNLQTINIPADRFGSVANWYIQMDKVWKIFANY